MTAKQWGSSPFKNYKWIVKDVDLLGGKLANRGTRFSVSVILGCIAGGMIPERIDTEYAPFPHEALFEIMILAPEILESPVVTV